MDFLYFEYIVLLDPLSNYNHLVIFLKDSHTYVTLQSILYSQVKNHYPKEKFQVQYLHACSFLWPCSPASSG